MTMHELLSCGLLKDTDAVRVVRSRPGNALDVRVGHWYEDRILAFHNRDLRALMEQGAGLEPSDHGVRRPDLLRRTL